MMKIRFALLATSFLYAAPALAVVDPPAASKNDQRMRTVVYDPYNPVQIYASPGDSLRIEVGPDETVVQVIVSDQGTIVPDPTDAAPASAATTFTGASSDRIPPSCDANLCRTIFGNFIYLKPNRALNPQPLFIQTSRVDASGKTVQVPYAFELLTQPAEGPAVKTASLDATPVPKPPPMLWGVRFVYPDRDKAAAAAAWRRRQDQVNAAEREAKSLTRGEATLPGPTANWRYGYRGSAATMPDDEWDDGRTTFLRFNGNRPLPNVYNRLPDNEKSIPAYAVEPDAAGNTLRIAHTDSKWFLWIGDEAGCLFNLGPDPVGATATTVALPVSAAARGAGR